MDPKFACLTIDDGPSTQFKKKLDLLITRRIPAILFCRGDFLLKRRHEALYAIKNGFVIGNHSLNHPRFSDLAIEHCYKQISRTDAIINALYKRLKIDKYPRVFRFPHGDKGDLRYGDLSAALSAEGKFRKDRIQKFLCQQGYVAPAGLRITHEWYRKAALPCDIDWRWTFDAMEYKLTRIPKNKALGKVLENMQILDSSGFREQTNSDEIVLVHDHERSTWLFLRIVDKLASMRLRFVSLRHELLTASMNRR